EPIEFFMLDYLASLPEGLAEKLTECLKVHEDLVWKLVTRNDRLRAQVRGLCRHSGQQVADAAASPKQATPRGQSATVDARCFTPPRSRWLSPNPSPRSPTSPSQALLLSVSSTQRTLTHISAASAEGRRKRLLRDDMAAKVEAMHADRVRQRDEMQEAHLTERLQRTMHAAKERVQAMARRAEREEEQLRLRSEAAMQTHEGLERSLEARNLLERQLP
ncbi:unnamed protein product, partial [Polarella glacialis]